MSTARNSEATRGGALRAVMRQVPVPVTVVTACSAEGAPYGITIGSFTSVSLQPPLISFNVSEEANAFERLVSAERFAVHMLSRRQAPLAEHFADPDLPLGRQFEGVRWQDGPDGVPVLEGAQAVLHCRAHVHFPAGDSTIVIGRVTGITRRGSVTTGPLLYHQRGYRTVEVETRGPGGRMLETPDPQNAKS